MTTEIISHEEINLAAINRKFSIPIPGQDTAEYNTVT